MPEAAGSYSAYDPSVHTWLNVDLASKRIEVEATVLGEFGAHMCRMRTELLDYSSIPFIEFDFECKVTECLIISYTATSITSQTYTIGDTLKVIPLPTDYVQYPACDYPTVFTALEDNATPLPGWITLDTVNK